MNPYGNPSLVVPQIDFQKSLLSRTFIPLTCHKMRTQAPNLQKGHFYYCPTVRAVVDENYGENLGYIFCSLQFNQYILKLKIFSKSVQHLFTSVRNFHVCLIETHFHDRSVTQTILISRSTLVSRI